MSRRRAGLALAALAALTVALGGCETTAEKSAKLEKAAKRVALVHAGLSIKRASRQAKVLEATVVHGSEGAAAAVTVRNLSSRALVSVPIAITVKGARGQTLYQNNAAGLETALTHVPSIPAHGTVTWVNDQVGSAGEPASVIAELGEASTASGPEPQIEVQGTRVTEASTGEASGTVRNGSSVAQGKLVVYVTARKGGRIVAAGRALLTHVAPGASVPFDLYLTGGAGGASLQAGAPPTTFG
ncbi:MAG TPA: hypothetical protein VMB51_14470 [Solirubrobacteraceae bacterium]|nr:hypothetical protein [Solirubrobacteraceae bacterium]